jgi:hypothetical protein
VNAAAETQLVGAACRRLLGLVEAQAEALESGDFSRFEVLFRERAALQRVFEDTPSGGLDTPSRALLEQVAELDRRTLGRARELLEGTADELRQL